MSLRDTQADAESFPTPAIRVCVEPAAVAFPGSSTPQHRPTNIALRLLFWDVPQLQGELDDLDKTVTFISPVKDGPGMSPLDRTLADDNRTRSFLDEIARLKAERRASEDRVAPCSSPDQPIGEVCIRATH